MPPERFGLWVGIWQVLYSLVVAALAYLTNALEAEQAWRILMTVMAAAGIGVAAALWLADTWLPRPDETTRAARQALRAQVRSAALNREVVLAAILFALTFGPVLAYSDLWAVPNQMAFGNSAEMAAGIAGMIPIGLGVGSLAVGWLSDRTGRPALAGAAAAAIGLAAIAALIFLPPLPGWTAAILTFLLGVGSAASVAALAYARRFAGPGQIGTAIGLVSATGSLGGGPAADRDRRPARSATRRGNGGDRRFRGEPQPPAVLFRARHRPDGRPAARAARVALTVRLAAPRVQRNKGNLTPCRRRRAATGPGCAYAARSSGGVPARRDVVVRLFRTSQALAPQRSGKAAARVARSARRMVRRSAAPARAALCLPDAAAASLLPRPVPARRRSSRDRRPR